MTDQDQNQTRLSIDEAAKLQADAEARRAAELKANSKFVKLGDGEQMEAFFTGEINTQEKVFEVGKPAKIMIVFDLTAKTDKGETKTISAEAGSDLAKQLLVAIKEGKRHVVIKRKGLGNKTQYTTIALTA